jgi:hypothetical protein
VAYELLRTHNAEREVTYCIYRISVTSFQDCLRNEASFTPTDGTGYGVGYVAITGVSVAINTTNE